MDIAHTHTHTYTHGGAIECLISWQVINPPSFPPFTAWHRNYERKKNKTKTHAEETARYEIP